MGREKTAYVGSVGEMLEALDEGAVIIVIDDALSASEILVSSEGRLKRKERRRMSLADTARLVLRDGEAADERWRCAVKVEAEFSEHLLDETGEDEAT